jgi:ribulose 1,5-bisphosphate synthetase/thiazole synthase
MWFLALLLITPHYTTAFDFDVLVYGATPAGVLSADAAAGEGARVALLDPRGVVGGAIAGGLCETDIGTTTAVIGGRARKFFEKAAAHYGKSGQLYAFEPRVAESIFRDYVLASKPALALALNARISRLEVVDGVIARAVLANGSALTAQHPSGRPVA